MTITRKDKIKIYCNHKITKSSLQDGNMISCIKTIILSTLTFESTQQELHFYTNASANCTCSTTISLDHKIGFKFTIHTYTHFKITSSTVSAAQSDGNKIRILHNIQSLVLTLSDWPIKDRRCYDK